MSEYTWKIDRLNTLQDGEPVLVASVDWTLSLTDGEDKVSTFGTVALPTPVDYDQFSQQTESAVIDLIQELMGTGVGRNARTYSQVLADLELQMRARKEPPVAPNPWASE